MTQSRALSYLFFAILFLIPTFNFGQAIDSLIQLPLNYSQAYIGPDPQTLTFDEDGNMLLITKIKDDFTLNVNGELQEFEEVLFTAKHIMIKANSDFEILWAREFISGSVGAQIHAVSIEESGGFYVTGILNGTADFDPSAAVDNYTIENEEDYNSYIAKYTAEGMLQWVQLFPYTRITKILENPEGGYHIAGLILDGVEVDLNPMSNPVTITNSDVYPRPFIAAYNSNGTLSTHHFFSGYGSVLNLSYSNDNHLLIQGGYANNTSFPTFELDPSGDVLTLPGERGNYLAKWTIDGSLVWAKSYGRNENGGATTSSIHLDTSGNIYLGGGFSYSIYDFATDTTQSAILDADGDSKAFFMKLDPEGNMEWVHALDKNSYDRSVQMTTTEAGNVLLAYSFSGTADADPGEEEYLISSVHDVDIALLKFSDEGTFQGASVLASQGNFGNNTVLPYCFRQREDGILLQTNFRLNYQSVPSFAQLQTPPSPAVMSLFRIGEESCGYFGLDIENYTAPTCSETGVIEVQAFSGTPPYSYEWQGTEPLLSEDIVLNDGGNYQVVATDANGCLTSTTIIVPEYDLNGPDLGADPGINFIGDEVRPGFDASFVLSSTNFDCEESDGILKFYAGDFLNFVNAVPSPTQIINDTLIWSYSELSADQSLTIDLNYEVSLAAQIGDSVNIYAEIFPTGINADVTNDAFTANLPVVNSFDPNDIRLFPKGECIPNYLPADTLLKYSIRFQNTGNSNAIFVHILDSIDPSLDMSTFHLLDHSHPVIVELEQDDLIRFRFDDIYLPPESSSSELSQGYVSYQIRTFDTAENLNQTSKFADIYFDFNEPITTNTVMHTISDGFHLFDTSINLNENTLNVLPIEDAAYTWGECISGIGFSPIEGASGTSFTPTETGEYAVLIERYGCSKMSDCISTTFLSTDQEREKIEVNLFPNPALDQIDLSWPQDAHIESFSIVDLSGRIHLEIPTRDLSKLSVNISHLRSGSYIVIPRGGKASVPVKLIKLK